MSVFQKCEMCSNVAEKVCECEQGHYLCLDHISHHVASSNQTHILQPLQNKLSQSQIKILQTTKLLLKQKLNTFITSLLLRRDQDIRQILEKISKVENKYQKVLKKVISKENDKLKEIQVIIEKKEIKFCAEERRLKYFQKRKEERFENITSKIYLDSFSFPIQSNFVSDYSTKITKSIENKFGPFVYDNQEDDFDVILLGPVQDGCDWQKGVYIGEWNSEGQKQGKGRKVYRDGCIQQGYWKKGKLHGKGRLIEPNGDFYEGMIVDGLFEGFGVYLCADGQKYEGNWNAGRKHGRGIKTSKNGDVYEGEFVDELFEGFGIQRYADGQKYEGNYKAWKKHGQGVWTFSNGDVYEGEFVEGLFEGFGIYRWEDGSKHQGNWKAGSKYGQGMFTDRNGKISIGYWVEGKLIK